MDEVRNIEGAFEFLQLDEDEPTIPFKRLNQMLRNRGIDMTTDPRLASAYAALSALPSKVQ